MIGIDPDHLLTPDSLLVPAEEPHEAVIARCGCGYEECDKMSVQISHVEETVFWNFRTSRSRKTSGSSAGLLRFDAGQYTKELDRAINDRSWESRDRTAARLLHLLVDREQLSRFRLTWEWALGQIEKEMFTVSLELAPGPFQLLAHTHWRDESPDEIALKVADLLKQHPSSWPDVQWNPQGEDQEATPSIAGPGWKRWDPGIP